MRQCHYNGEACNAQNGRSKMILVQIKLNKSKLLIGLIIDRKYAIFLNIYLLSWYDVNSCP